MEANKNVRISVIVMAMLIVVCLLTGYAAQEATAEPPEPTAEDHSLSLKEHIYECLDDETEKTVSEVRVLVLNGEHNITIRVISAGGFFFPDVIEQTAQQVFEKADELGAVISSYYVMEYSENSSGDMGDMITWHS